MANRQYVEEIINTENIPAFLGNKDYFISIIGKLQYYLAGF